MILIIFSIEELINLITITIIKLFLLFKMKLIIVIVIIVVILFISFSLINILDFYKLSKNNEFIEMTGGLNLDQGFYSLVEIIDFKK